MFLTLKRLYPVLAALVLLWPSYCLAQAEIPALIQQGGSPNVMLLIDDSGSMWSVLEHEEFDREDPALVALGFEFPSLIFKVKSGRLPNGDNRLPGGGDDIQPVMWEYNGRTTDDGEKKEPFAPFPWGNPDTWDGWDDWEDLLSCPEVKKPGKLDFDDEEDCPDVPSEATFEDSKDDDEDADEGIGVLRLWSEDLKMSGVIGRRLFQEKYLARNAAGEILTDPDGHEYLITEYRYAREPDMVPYLYRPRIYERDKGYKSRQFHHAGGTIALNGREIDLTTGLYRVEYLKWLFYFATPAQVASIPNKTRLDATKEVLEKLINENPTIRFGLSVLVGTEKTSTKRPLEWQHHIGGDGQVEVKRKPQNRIVAPVGTAHAELIEKVRGLQAVWGQTPILGGYAQTLRYFAGEEKYPSPIQSACDQSFVVMLTDGTPYKDTSGKLFGAYPIDYDGDGNDEGGNADDCEDEKDDGDNFECAEFADDLAFHAWRQADFHPGHVGAQRVQTYVVGLAAFYPLLDQIAQNGGSGQGFEVSTEAELLAAFRSIFATVITSKTSGGGVALADSYGADGRIYRPSFLSGSWTGEIDVFDYNKTTKKLDFAFDIADVYQARDLLGDPRLILAGTDPDGDGRTATADLFIEERAAEFGPQLFRHYIDGTLPPAELAEPLQEYTKATAAQTLIQFLRGTDLPDLRSRDADGVGIAAELGDIVYSQPFEVGPQNGGYVAMKGYYDFVQANIPKRRIMLVGANDGMLHAFDSTTGKELWAYIPSILLPELEKLSRPSYNFQYRRSYVDGLIAVEDAFIGGSWKTIAIVGLRTGGSSYTVLDITNRESPSLLFEVNDPEVTGQSWTRAVVFPVGGSGNDPATFRWYFAVGTGEGKDGGTDIGVYALETAGVPPVQRIPLAAATAPDTRTSGVAAIQSDRDLAVDRLYVGTEDGDVFRVELNGTTPAGWTAKVLFDGSPDHPIVVRPKAVISDNPAHTSIGTEPELAIGLYWGTGKYDEMGDLTSVGGIAQRFVGVFDPVDAANDTYASAASSLTYDQLQNQSHATYSVEMREDGIYRLPTGKKGFFIPLNTDVVKRGGFLEPAGMVLHERVNFRGALLVPTFVPPGGDCGGGGHSLLMGLNFRTGGGFLVDYQTQQGTPFFNGGVPETDNQAPVTEADLDRAIKIGAVEPGLDAKIESHNPNSVTPYEHSGTLEANDIWFDPANGGVFPAVSSLGSNGVAGPPTVLEDASQIILQTAYVDPIEVGAPTPTSGGPGGGVKPPPGGSGGAETPPDQVPFAVPDEGARVVSFHESTLN